MGFLTCLLLKDVAVSIPLVAHLLVRHLSGACQTRQVQYSHALRSNVYACVMSYVRVLLCS